MWSQIFHIKKIRSTGPDGHPIPRLSRPKEDLELEAIKIPFDQDDLDDAYQKHHDGLINQLTVANCFTKRVLVDSGSSTNIIFFDTIKVSWDPTPVGGAPMKEI